MISPKQEKWLPRLGNRLKVAREACGYRVGEVESRLGLARGHIGKLEKGKITPNAWLIRRIAKMYNISPGWMLGIPKFDGIKPEKITPRIRHFVHLPNRKMKPTSD